MSIEWQEELATGIESIDAQHKGIFAWFAEFKSACDAGRAKEELARLLLFLEDYARDHFNDEEKALLEAGYPELADQQVSHKRFLNDIMELKRRVDENGSDMPEIMEMKRLLINWLIQHIRHQDMAYVDFLKGPAGDRQKETKP